MLIDSAGVFGGLGFAFGLGDINGDGLDDFATRGRRGTLEPVIRVFLGRKSFDGTASFEIRGEAQRSGFGYQISSGDINNDGLNDLVTGDPSNQSNGAAYIFFGSRDNWHIKEESFGGKINQPQIEVFPHPFNPKTQIKVKLPVKSQLSISIFDPGGTRIRKLYSGNQAPGTYQTSWDGRNLQGKRVASGTYLVSIQVNKKTTIKKVVLLK